MTRVLIVDDHPIFRDGLAGLLATLPEIEVAGTAGTAEEALTALEQDPPDVVLMHISLPGASGVEATRQATQIAPATAVLIITMVDDDDTVYAALAAGARGYVLKGSIRRPDRRRAAHSRGRRRRVRRRDRRPAPRRPHAATPWPCPPPHGDLTGREREVLNLLADGASNRHIARTLGISLKTVQNHVSHILDKLQAADRTQAVLRARSITPSH